MYVYVPTIGLEIHAGDEVREELGHEAFQNVVKEGTKTTFPTGRKELK